LVEQGGRREAQPQSIGTQVHADAYLLGNVQQVELAGGRGRGSLGFGRV
jgi:hypothetical protein